MSNSNLIRVLLLFTLVGTLSSNYALKTSAQVTNGLSLTAAEQRQAIPSNQDILQKIDLIQQKAKNFRQTVDSVNLQLQEQVNSPKSSQIVDFSKALANWEQLNIIWHDFTKDLEKNPEFFKLLQEDKVFHSIDQNLTFQKEIIANLAKIFNQSSYSADFEEKTQHKFALTSTNKARELELQVSQIENILANYLLYKEQINNTSYNIIKATTTNSTDIKNFEDNSAPKTKFLTFKILIVLTLLSSCGMFIFLRSYKQNNSSVENQNFDEEGNKETPLNDFADYLENVQKVENQARQLLNSTEQIIENQHDTIKKKQEHQINEHFMDIAAQRSPNSPSFERAESFSSTTKQVVQESLSITKNLATEEDVIVLYRKNRQLLLQKAIKVAVNQESRQRIKAGAKSEIIFEKVSSGSYWIITEPKLENDSYFLVPNPILGINALIDQSVDQIFTCTRYNNRTSDNFNLKFSAIVQVHGANSWKLIGTGEITFS